MSIMKVVDRWVKGAVLVATAFAGLAFYANHTTQPCTSDQLGAGGMCVTTSVGGVL